MPGILATVLRCSFAGMFLGCTTAAAVLMRIVHFVPVSLRWREGVSLFILQIAWRIAFIASPWVRCMPGNDAREQWAYALSRMQECEAEDVQNGADRRPLFVLINHSSFLDSIVWVATTPIQIVWRCRSYCASYLYETPVLSTISKCVGHFPVHFSSKEEGVFKAAADKMEKVEKDVDRHLKEGGWLAFFPEGQMNKEPSKVLPFRFGGMRRALDFDARIVMVTCRGNEVPWPRRALVGGYPGTTRYSVKCVAMGGAKEFVQHARAEASAEEKELPDHAVLARRLQELMQAEYDGMASGEDGSGKRLEALSQKMRAAGKKD